MCWVEWGKVNYTSVVKVMKWYSNYLKIKSSNYLKLKSSNYAFEVLIKNRWSGTENLLTKPNLKSYGKLEAFEPEILLISDWVGNLILPSRFGKKKTYPMPLELAKLHSWLFTAHTICFVFRETKLKRNFRQFETKSLRKQRTLKIYFR